MKFSLRTKLSLSYISVVLIAVILISVITNLLLEKHFKDYIIANQELKNNELISLLGQQYHGEGVWDIESIENICVNALKQGMVIKVVDSLDTVVWDARLHDNALCEYMLDHMARNMANRYPKWSGGYVEESYPILYQLQKVGRVEIGYYGPYYYNDSDLTFINSINRLLLIIGVLSLVLSLAIGAIMAKRLSRPISKVIATAEMISKGYFDDRITEQSSTKEIVRLTDTINNLAQTLEKQETLRKKLTADVAHELRTPLATLQSHMEAMIDGIWKPDQDRLISCHEEIIRINNMVGDLERLARYESENLILTKSEFDISELIRHLLQNFEKDFLNKEIALNFSGKQVMILADKDKISQVIVNLLSNALKYTLQGGSVEVAVDEYEENIRIRIKDNGIGIALEDQHLIFERFFRVDKSRDRKTGGAGIGLAITKAIVLAHQGDILVKSKIKEGTEFQILLPK